MKSGRLLLPLIVLLCLGLAEAAPAAYEWVVTEGPAAGTYRQVYALAADGTSHRVLFEDPAIPDGQCLALPAVSPDQKKIAYHYGRGFGSWDRGPIYCANLITWEVWEVSGSGYRDIPAASICWLPTSQELLFSNADSGVHRIDLYPGTTDERVITTQGLDEVTSVRCYDSRAALANGGGRGADHAFTLDTLGQVRAWDPWGDNSAYLPGYSPEGASMTFYRRGASSYIGLYVATADGAGPVLLVEGIPLTVPSPDAAPGSTSHYGTGFLAWAPDARSIAFLSGEEIWAVDTDGGNLRQLTHGEFLQPRVWGAIMLDDTDGDGMPDEWEIARGFDPAAASDGAADADGDGLSNTQEYVGATDPRRSDSDGDGFTDVEEVYFATIAADPADFPTAGSFSDVPVTQWAWHEIEACCRSGIVSGYGDGSYRPEAVVTRDQMAVYIARALAGGEENVPDFTGEPSSLDVSAMHWALDYVEYAVANGVVYGYDGQHYRPDNEVTRDQMAVYMARALVAPLGDLGLIGYVPAEPRNFPDAPEGFWAYMHIEYCVEKGVVSGYVDGYYRPERTVGRDQMAVYVARAFGLVL